MMKADDSSMPLFQIGTANEHQGGRCCQFRPACGGREFLEANEGFHRSLDLQPISLPLLLIYVYKDGAPEILGRVGCQDSGELIKRATSKSLTQEATVGLLSEFGGQGGENRFQFFCLLRINEEGLEVSERREQGALNKTVPVLVPSEFGG